MKSALEKFGHVLVSELICRSGGFQQFVSPLIVKEAVHQDHGGSRSQHCKEFYDVSSFALSSRAVLFVKCTAEQVQLVQLMITRAG